MTHRRLSPQCAITAACLRDRIKPRPVAASVVSPLCLRIVDSAGTLCGSSAVAGQSAVRRDQPDGAEGTRGTERGRCPDANNGKFFSRHTTPDATMLGPPRFWTLCCSCFASERLEVMWDREKAVGQKDRLPLITPRVLGRFCAGTGNRRRSLEPRRGGWPPRGGSSRCSRFYPAPGGPS